MMNLEQTLKEYSTQLKRFISSRVKRKADVDDIHQEVLIKTFRHFNNIKDPKKFRAWLYKTARTTLIDYYRASDRYSLKDLSDLEDDRGVLEDVQKQLATCLKPFFKNLPDKYRKPLEAVELQSISQKDLAKSMGISYSGLKSRIQRGRQMLYQQYKSCCDYEMDARGGVVSFKPKTGNCKSC